MREGTRLLVFLAVMIVPVPVLLALLALGPGLENPALGAVFWPAKLCARLAGPGPEFGPPGHRWREGTPVQMLADVLGFCLTYVFWLAVILAVLKYRSHRANRVNDRAGR